MSALIFSNNATTTLNGSINDAQTSISVTNSGLFPIPSGGDYFYATMYELSGSTEINIEIVKVTAVVGATWTVARAQDSTTARARSGSTTVYIELRWNSASAQLMLQKSNNLSDLPSAATARTNLGLGSMATQAADNVAITGGSITGVSIQTLDSTTTIADNSDPTKKIAFEVSGVTTGTTRTLTVPNASGTLALLADLSAGYQPLDADLTALAGLNANGLIARTDSGAVAVRSIVVPASGMSISNADGVSGNPTLALANDLAAVENLTETGFVRRTGADTWSAGDIANSELPATLTGKTYNGLSLTAATTGFTVAGGTTSKTLTVSNTLTLAGTDGSTLNIGSGGTLGTGAYATIANYAALAGATFTGNIGLPNTGSLQIKNAAGVAQGVVSWDSGNNILIGDYGNSTASILKLHAGTASGQILFYKNNAETARIDNNGNLGVGSNAPATRLHVYNSAITGGSPASSGSAADTNSLVRFGMSSVVLDFGVYANGDGWMQMRSASNYATNYALGINPNGGRSFFGGAVQEAKVAMAATDINLSAGNVFTKTISGATTLTVSNTPATGTVASFILELTNPGSNVTFWTGVKWAGGTAPTLTTSGTDVLGFYTHDGGTTWRGLVLAKDSK